MSLRRIALLLVLVSCAGAPAPREQPKRRLPPSLPNVLKEPVIGDLDLRLATAFRGSGNVRSGGSVLKPLPGDFPRRYDVSQFMQYGEELLVWCQPAPNESTLGIALRTDSRRRIVDRYLPIFGLERKQSLGLIEAPGRLAGHAAVTTNRDDCLIAGPWVVMQFDEALREQLHIGDGSTLTKHGEELVAAKQFDEARALILALHDTGDASAREKAKQIGQAFIKQNEPFEQRAETQWQKIETQLLAVDFGDAVKQAMTQSGKSSELVDAEGKPLASIAQWPARARSVVLRRLQQEIAGRSRRDVPMLHALLDLVQQHWRGDGTVIYFGSVKYLVGTVAKAMAAKNPEQLAKVCEGYYHYTGDSVAARDWARQLTRAAGELSRQVLQVAAQSAPRGSLRRVACEELASLRKPADLNDVVAALQGLARLEAAKTPRSFVAWFSQRDRRARMQATKLDEEVLSRASIVIDGAREDALAKGGKIEAACWLLLRHTFTATEAPAPVWSHDALISTDDGDLARARKVVSEALCEISPLARSQSSIPNDILTGPYARAWPLTRKLGIDIGPSSALHKHVHGDIALEKLQEDHLVTNTDPWSWQQRSAKRLMFDRDPLSWLRMGTLFVGKELTASAKDLKARRESIVSRSQDLNQRGEMFKAQSDAQQKVVAEFQRAMNNKTLDPSSARSRAKSIDARSGEIGRFGRGLGQEAKALQAEIDRYNEDRRSYQNSRSEEQADKHAEIETQLATSMNVLMDQRLELWAKGKTENDVQWMRWLLGRATGEFRGFGDGMSPNAQRLARSLDQDGVRVFRKSGRVHVGKALARHWDGLCELKYPDRVTRIRKLFDQYVKTFGLDQAFSKVFMTTNYASEMKDEVLTDDEAAEFKKHAQGVMDGYREHMRKVNKR